MDDRWRYESARDLGLSNADRARSIRREVGLLTTMMTTLRWVVVRCYLRVFHRLRVEGAEHLPGGLPIILVANHSSHLDALVLASVLSADQNRRVFPVAAGDHFFETRVAAVFTSLLMNALPIWRKNCGAHALEELRARLGDVPEPCGYILFPEGTRSRMGEMSRFKPGIGRLVAATNVPVVPCFLAGAHAAFPPDRRWPRPGKVVLKIGEPLMFAEMPNDKEGWRSIAKLLEQKVRRLRDRPTGAGGGQQQRAVVNN
jgi:1-acyl-sn-glycerol-3-phosphate acyltransferase